MPKARGLLFLLALLSVAAMAAEELSAVGDPWLPWNRGEAGRAPEGGIAVELARAVFAAAGVDGDLRLFPWPRCLAMLERGEADIAWFLTKNQEREGYLVFSEALLKDPYLIFSRKGSGFAWKDWKDLRGRKIGITAGFNYGDEFWAAAKEEGFELLSSMSDEVTARNLLLGRVDLAILNSSIARQLVGASAEFRDKLESAAKPVTESTYYMAFSKKSGKLRLLPRINEAILLLKKSGKLEEILKNAH